MISQSTRRWFWWGYIIGDDDDDDDKNVEEEPSDDFWSGSRGGGGVEFTQTAQLPMGGVGGGPRFRSHHFFSNSYVAL